jgi:hypothetical protein
MLCRFVVLALLVASQSQSTAATKSSKTVVFHATGEFESWYGLTGTVTIETTTGRVLSTNLAVVDAGGDIVAAFTGIGTSTNSAGDVEIALIAGSFIDPTAGIVLVIASTSLKKYTGGSLVPDESYWWWANTSNSNVIDPLVGGSLEP